jgi:hypothetical protein
MSSRSPPDNGIRFAIDDAESHAVFLERDRRFEERRRGIRAQALTGIMHLDRHLPVAGSRRHTDRATRAGRFGGVLEEVRENAFHAVGSSRDMRRSRVEFEIIRRVRVGRPEQRDAFSDDRVDVEDLRDDRLLEKSENARTRRSSVDFAHHDLHD